MIEINGKKYAPLHFDNRELNYKEFKVLEHNLITLKFENNEELFSLWFIVKYMREQEICRTITLDLPYLPYSAMDRKMSDQLFSLKYFSEYISSLSVDVLTVLDPHNYEVTRELFKDVIIYEPYKLIEEVIDNNHYDIIMFPDKGAMARYKDLDILERFPKIYGNKVRDLNDNGKIISYELINSDNVSLKDRNILIVDDLCRYGGTFVRASKLLLEEFEPNKVDLCVTHCELNIVYGDIFKNECCIQNVFTTDSNYLITELKGSSWGDRVQISKSN